MLVFSIISAILAFCAALLELKRDLMMLQQNSNRNDRYIKWMKKSGDSTRIARLLAMIVALLFLVSFSHNIISISCSTLLSIYIIYSLLRAKYKLPLVFTKRAIRIYSVSIALTVIFCAIIVVVRGLHLNDGSISGKVVAGSVTLASIIVCAVSYLFTMASNWLLKPIEKSINRKYYNEAAQILRSMPGLKVIGITGSYGKTSTKHYLHRILSEKYDVLMTPGNFNTTLGVIRTVREHMKPYNQVFLAEMGAKQRGDIKEICDLVKPEIGIITAVGPQHLESFKTIEGVQATKFELADALPSDGFVVINNDFEYIANRPVENTECIRYSVENSDKGNYVAKDIKYSPRGTDFTIVSPDGNELTLHTRLVGRCNVSNLLAAVIVAKRLGVSDEKIRYAIEKIEQVEHRLSLKPGPGGITIIDDAYNSNPVGSAMALEVLSGMTQGKRIVITPGMIELGDDQYRLNYEFGEKIAKSVDFAIIVGEYNREAIVEGIKAGGLADDKIHLADSFMSAHNFMMSIAAKCDTVLLENDLPDTFK